MFWVGWWLFIVRLCGSERALVIFYGTRISANTAYPKDL